jgi:hypothetical protein
MRVASFLPFQATYYLNGHSFIEQELNRSKVAEQFHGNLNDVNSKKIKGGPGKQRVAAKRLRLAQEIKYIQRRAAQYDASFVTAGPLVFFSTETGDAWMLDPSDQLAARLARDGDPEPIDFRESDTNFAIGWKG